MWGSGEMSTIVEARQRKVNHFDPVIINAKLETFYVYCETSKAVALASEIL